MSELTLEPSENQVQVDFVGLDFSPGAVLRYQYKLEGADSDWGAATGQRSVNYANLRPGSYRFMVRAVSADGLTSTIPAVVSFRILPPLWQRWWFLLLAAAGVGLTIHALYRYRLKQLLALERVRTRIATDLHDDIGSCLSQVSVLSEVVRRRIGSDPEVAEPLGVIAQLSRDLVYSMSDIVWAVNPKRDRLSDLTQRMRRHASDLFTARDIAFTFTAPDARTIYVSGTTPGAGGVVLKLPAFGEGFVTESLFAHTGGGSEIAQGASVFSFPFTTSEGVGPLFNGQSCSSCHNSPTAGGMGAGAETFVTRVAKTTGGRFDSMDGRASTVADAIGAHGGQGAAAATGDPEALERGDGPAVRQGR